MHQYSIRQVPELDEVLQLCKGGTRRGQRPERRRLSSYYLYYCLPSNGAICQSYSLTMATAEGHYFGGSMNFATSKATTGRLFSLTVRREKRDENEEVV